MNLPRITTAMLVVTHDCNLRCRYCFVDKNPCKMTYETAKAAAEFVIKNAEEDKVTPGINFFGGEPMLMWDSIIVPLVNWVRHEYKKPFHFGITTNGTLLNEERIQFMKDNNFSILFSIDGGKATQDYNRPYPNGTGSFDQLEPIIPLLLDKFPKTTFRMTAIPETCGNMFNDIMYAEQLGFKQFFVIPNVLQTWTDKDRAVLKAEFQKYGDYYIEQMRKNIEPISFSRFERAFNEIKAINKAIKRNEFRVDNRCKACGKCGLGASKYAAVHPNGNIYGCQEMTSNVGETSIFYIGNIFTGVEEDRRAALINEFNNTQSVGDDCQNCKYNRICDGGCVSHNFMTSESLNIVPPDHCLWNRIVLDEAIKVMQTLGAENNQMFKQRWDKA